MSTRKTLAFIRQDYLTVSSYRMRVVFSLLALVAFLAPLYFVAQALQPLMARSIAAQGHHYFAFLLIGSIAVRWVVVAVTALPEAMTNSIRSGSFESLFTTPVRMGEWVTGLMGYRLVWTAVETCVMLAAGLLLGVRLAGSGIATGIAILMLTTVTYAAFGIAGGAMILFFRTTGPVMNVIVLGSTLLGGVYYPTHVIPSWIQSLAAIVPLSYGLRSMRMSLLEGAPFSAIRTDVLMLALYALLLLTASVIALRQAIRYARQSGTLAQY